MAISSELTVLKSIVVELAPEEAFSLFVDQARWWPLQTHHLAWPPGETVTLEPFVGGRWFERAADGCECDWGRVLVWQPPTRLVVSWHVRPDWSYEPDPARASEIEVRFVAAGTDRTRVKLEHRHLERYGNQAERMRSILDAPDGAMSLLQAFADAARGGKDSRR